MKTERGKKRTHGASEAMADLIFMSSLLGLQLEFLFSGTTIPHLVSFINFRR